MKPLLSIVIPCHNRRDELEATLLGLCRQTQSPQNFEVLVVDQASQDGSRELVCTLRTPYRLGLLEQAEKYGISAARNAGIAAASSEWVLLLDADLLPEAELVESHLSSLASTPQALICGRVLPYFPAYPDYIDRVSNPDAGLDRGHRPGSLPFYQMFGGHVSLSKATFAAVGSFNPCLKGFEDIEFAYRAARLGVPIINCPEAVSYHNHRRAFVERCAQARLYHQMLPSLQQAFPGILEQIPVINRYLPIHWLQDFPSLILPKLDMRFFSLPVIQRLSKHILAGLNRRKGNPRLARFLYWRILISSGYLGYREAVARVAQKATA